MPPKRRQLMRFSLRTFLLIVSVFCIWVAWFSYRAESQRKAIAWILKYDNSFTYDFEVDQDAYSLSDPELPGPDWLRNLLGVDYLANVVEVDLSNDRLTPADSPSKPIDQELRETTEFDVGPLSGLKHVRVLSIYGNVKNLSPLSVMTRLEKLVIDSDTLEDLTPLTGLTQLEWLRISSKLLRDIGPLSRMSNLEYLDLSDTNVADLHPLSKLFNLEGLCIDRTPVEDLSPIRNLMALEHLGFQETLVRSVEPLSRIPEYTDLEIFSTQVQDLSPLVDFADLTRLGIRRSPVTNWETLSQLKNLKRLYIGLGTNVDLEPITGLGLEFLALGGCQVRDLSPLATLSELKVLVIDHVDCERLPTFNGLPNLTEIRISETNIKDLSFLCGCDELNQVEKMSLEASTELVDLTGIESLTGLRTLDLSDAIRLEDLTPLEELKNLEELNLCVEEQWVDQWPITKEQIAKLKKELPNCRIRVWDLALSRLHSRRTGE